MEIVSTGIFTKAGRDAIIDANLNNKNIELGDFALSAQDLPLDEDTTEIPYWRKEEISILKKIGNNTAELTLITEPEEALYYIRTVAIFLKDGTLFMLAKPNIAMPSHQRQIYKIQYSFTNLDSVMSFDYLPFSEDEQDLGLMNATSSLGILILKALNGLRELGQRVESIYKKSSSDMANIELKISNVREEMKMDCYESALMALNTTAVLGNMILDNADKNRTITTK